MNAVAQKEEQSVRPSPIPSDRNYVVPSVNIYESKDGYVLEAEMPGVTKDGLEITLENNLLTLTGHRNPSALPNSEALYRESRDVNFRRTFELDPAIDAGKIQARVEQGILTLTLPKAEQVKPRKITVS